MAKNFQLTIPEPCHENWDNMTARDRGRFCGSCQKTVVDFTLMSDGEIAQLFKKPSTGSVCGRFMQDQLNKNIHIPAKRIPWVKYFFQIALPAFLTSSKLMAQGSVVLKTTPTQKTAPIKKDNVLKPNCNAGVLGQVAPQSSFQLELPKKISFNDTTTLPEVVLQSYKIERMGKMVMGYSVTKISKKLEVRGKVIDDKGDPIPFASIYIKGTTNGVPSDVNGKFTLPNKGDKKHFFLVASAPGFEESLMKIKKKDLTSELIINLKPVKLPEDVVIVGFVARKKPRSIPLIPDIVKDTLTKLFRSYPNPVVAGTSLNLEWNQTETGNYFLQLISQSGQLLFSRKLWIDAEAKVLSLDIPRVAAGSYYLRMTNSGTGKSFTEKIIIQ